MDKKAIEGLRTDVNTLLNIVIELLKEEEVKAYNNREIDLLKPIAKVKNSIREHKINIVKELDKLSKMKSNW